MPSYITIRFFKNLLNLKTGLLIILGAHLVTGCNDSGTEIPSADEVKATIILVNDHWQQNHPTHGRAFWDNAAYHTGNIEAYRICGEERFLDYSIAWADLNHWKGAISENKENWKYTYGETQDHVLFGDWQICFQTYIDLYNFSENKDSVMVKRAVEVMEYQISTDRSDYWWWADGLYMVMPVMSKLYQLTGNEKYLDKLYEYFSYAKSIMYDTDAALFYRDVKYLYPGHMTINGHKDFWSRGNGWVFAGLAKVLQDLPVDCKYKDEFLSIYNLMAIKLVYTQQEEGCWSRSILDNDFAPGPETSGTAFFTYGMLWGINNGYLDIEEFLPAAMKGWNYLAGFAISKDGSVGYVQPIGEKAIPGQSVDQNSSSNFGVGAVLLAASEMYHFSEKNSQKK